LYWSFLPVLFVLFVWSVVYSLERLSVIVSGVQYQRPNRNMAPSPSLEPSSGKPIPTTHLSSSEFIVWWDEPETEDPENPMNWSPSVKWANILTLSVISFLV
jgi:hypothetical protein